MKKKAKHLNLNLKHKQLQWLVFYDVYPLPIQDTCDLNMKTHEGQAPLHIATGEGHIRGVECLVGYGADVGVKDLKRVTPLHLVLAKKNMKSLSPATPHLNEVTLTL